MFSATTAPPATAWCVQMLYVGAVWECVRVSVFVSLCLCVRIFVFACLCARPCLALRAHTAGDGRL